MSITDLVLHTCTSKATVALNIVDFVFIFVYPRQKSHCSNIPDTPQISNLLVSGMAQAIRSAFAVLGVADTLDEYMTCIISLVGLAGVLQYPPVVVGTEIIPRSLPTPIDGVIHTIEGQRIHTEACPRMVWAVARK